jgi:hypothetical protein
MFIIFWILASPPSSLFKISLHTFFTREIDHDYFVIGIKKYYYHLHVIIHHRRVFVTSSCLVQGHRDEEFDCGLVLKAPLEASAYFIIITAITSAFGYINIFYFCNRLRLMASRYQALPRYPVLLPLSLPYNEKM